MIKWRAIIAGWGITVLADSCIALSITLSVVANDLREPSLITPDMNILLSAKTVLFVLSAVSAITVFIGSYVAARFAHGVEMENVLGVGCLMLVTTVVLMEPYSHVAPPSWYNFISWVSFGTAIVSGGAFGRLINSV